MSFCSSTVTPVFVKDVAKCFNRRIFGLGEEDGWKVWELCEHPLLVLFWCDVTWKRWTFSVLLLGGCAFIVKQSAAALCLQEIWIATFLPWPFATSKGHEPCSKWPHWPSGQRKREVIALWLFTEAEERKTEENKNLSAWLHLNGWSQRTGHRNSFCFLRLNIQTGWFYYVLSGLLFDFLNFLHFNSNSNYTVTLSTCL